VADISDAMLEATARDAEHLALLRALQLRSAIIAPLIARGRTLGALTLLAAESGRRYDARDLRVAEDLAARAALAVDNARLYRAAQDHAASQARLNAELQRRTAELRQALETRDEFLASASHDLKNPVAAIKATAQLLQRRLVRAGRVDTDELAASLARIDTIATRAADLIDELLDVARLHMGSPLELDRQPIDLVALVAELVAEHQQRSQIHQLRFESSVPQVLGRWDPRRLARVVANLLDNALKYTPEGGLIDVRVGRTEPPDTRAVVTVQDSGLGIAPEDLERIFARFHRGSNVVGRIAGTGLGLASARHSIESHGGTIQVVSELQRGSTFTIYLPCEGDA
jgi:signal transduction histidine kinase